MFDTLLMIFCSMFKSVINAYLIFIIFGKNNQTPFLIFLYTYYFISICASHCVWNIADYVNIHWCLFTLPFCHFLLLWIPVVAITLFLTSQRTIFLDSPHVISCGICILYLPCSLNIRTPCSIHVIGYDNISFLLMAG